MANTYVNKVQLADGTSLIDISDTTATADKILQGYTAYGADGSKLTGTATGGGGSVTQDQDGFIVLPPDGGGSPSVGGLEYEEGTWTPSEDIIRPTISFTNTHTTTPTLILMADETGTYSDVTLSNYLFTYVDWYRFTGHSFYNSSASQRYGGVFYGYRNTSTTQISYTSMNFSYSSDNTTDTNSSYPRYFVSSTDFKPSPSSAVYWRSGRTYKWIAIWAPTT